MIELWFLRIGVALLILWALIFFAAAVVLTYAAYRKPKP